MALRSVEASVVVCDATCTSISVTPARPLFAANADHSALYPALQLYLAVARHVCSTLFFDARIL
jgi:hypothetical protein